MGKVRHADADPNITRKSEAVVWAIVDDNATPIHVDVVGWNTHEDIAASDVRAQAPTTDQS